jgi:hypothetical protein
MRICYIFIAITLAIGWLPVQAQAGNEQDELQLLSSWGFQPDAAGRLVFKEATQQPVQKYQPWVPDLSRIELHQPVAQSVQSLQPLVVSAKKKRRE